MMPTLTPESRSSLLDEFENTRFDFVIVGGGITGAAIAREAAARGLRIALVEANDFAEGTSSRSSKLIHGGLRYLATGELGFIRETARERAAVYAIAPHLVEPCWMITPARSRALEIQYRAGIRIYEGLGSISDTDRHWQIRGDALTSLEPSVRSDLYERAVAHREYLTDDTRLVIGVLRAAVATGARVCSRLPVVGLVHRNSHIDGVVVRCALTDREFALHGDVIVNAAGPWVEEIGRMEENPPKSQLHLSRGVHIVVTSDRLPVNHPILCTADDKRWVFVIPRGDVVYVGTTDVSYTGNRKLWPEVTSEDVRYLLAPMPRYFTVDPIGHDDVVATWSGLRALPARDEKESRTISRKSALTVGPKGMISVAGGKLTGFRRVAEAVVELGAEQLKRSLAAGPGLSPIPGAVESSTGSGRFDERLFRLYGSETSAVVARGDEPIIEGGSVLEGEIDWAVDQEAALTLEDVLYRRTQAAWFLPTERDDLAPAAAAHMARLLGWDAARTALELATVQARFEDEVAFRARV